MPRRKVATYCDFEPLTQKFIKRLTQMLFVITLTDLSEKHQTTLGEKLFGKKYQANYLHLIYQKKQLKQAQIFL